MVFLRPVVVRDAAASDALMMDRYDSIRAAQQVVQPTDSTILGNVSGAPVLPQLQTVGPVQSVSPVPFVPDAPRPARVQPTADSAYSAP
ncbi:hypothetical protein D3C78_1115360 [compost metagenome]